MRGAAREQAQDGGGWPSIVYGLRVAKEVGPVVRSEGQFNAVVYEQEDPYRGQERRDVILMNPSDRERLGLKVDQKVTVSSDTGSMSSILVREFDIAQGCALMYCPEANVLIPRVADPKSRTPASKSVAVKINP